MSDLNSHGGVLLYQTEDGKTQIEVTLENETVWLSIDQMAELFQRNKSTISRHIKGVLESGELDADSVVAFFATTAADGKQYNVAYYSLDMIISVGYRVNSHRGVQFRIWATQVLKEYIVKGFALNDSLLKSAGGGNYFEHEGLDPKIRRFSKTLGKGIVESCGQDFCGTGEGQSRCRIPQIP